MKSLPKPRISLIGSRSSLSFFFFSPVGVGEALLYVVLKKQLFKVFKSVFTMDVALFTN